MTSDIRQLPVIDVTNKNIDNLTPAILNAIKTCSFLALDLELSGLGKPDILKSRDMDDRYSKFSEVVKSRAVLSLGISAFNHLKTVNDQVQSFLVQTFNLSLLSQDLYVVDPSSLQFLTSHGFDFNQQYSQGITYYAGNDKESKSPVRELFAEMVRCRKPIVLRNGFIDIMFLYQHFYAQLPAKYGTFVADLTELFSGGVFDTKYLVMNVLNWRVSFLAYAFRKCQRLNMEYCEGGKRGLILSFPTYPLNSAAVNHIGCRFVHIENGYRSTNKEIPFCKQFTQHGWCSDGNSNCSKSHNIDLAIDHELFGNVEDKDVDGGETTGLSDCLGAHRAGFDAFMTGYIMGYVLSRHGKKKPLSFEDFGMTHQSNRVNLAAKGIPLIITKSVYAKNSAAHRLKYDNIFVQK